MKTSTLTLAAGMGALSGLRTFTPPAVISHQDAVPRLPRKWRWLRSQRVAKIVSGLAVSELVGDKLPWTPSRLEPGALIARASSGAAVGAMIAAGRGGRGRTVTTAAVLGGLSAVAAAFAGYYLRRSLGKNWNVPDPAIGAVEDAITIGGAFAIAKRA
jgi:uncharacterized membrane protein